MKKGNTYVDLTMTVHLSEYECDMFIHALSSAVLSTTNMDARLDMRDCLFNFMRQIDGADYDGSEECGDVDPL